MFQQKKKKFICLEKKKIIIIFFIFVCDNSNFFIFIILLLLLRCLLLRWLLFQKLVNLLLWTSQKLNSYFAVFEQVNWLFYWLWICQKFNSYLGDFEQVNWLFCYFEHVKNLIFILLTWLQPIYYNSRLVLKTLIKNIEQEPH